MQWAGAGQCAKQVPTAAPDLAYQYQPSELAKGPSFGCGPTPDGPAIALTALDPTVVRGWLINALNDRLVVCQGVPTRPHGLKVKTIGTLIAGALLDGYGALGRAPFDLAQQRGPETQALRTSRPMRLPRFFIITARLKPNG
jgi:hypothetical protein